MWLVDWFLGLFYKKPEEEVVELDGLSPEEKRDKRREQREKRKATRRQWRLDKINAIKEKFYAVAAKRKWLFFIIAGAVVAYLVFSYSGFASTILKKVGGFFS